MRYTNAHIDSHLTKEGLTQYMVYRYDDVSIQVAGNGSDYIRLAVLIGLDYIAIYCIPDNHSTLSLEVCRRMKQEMYDTLALDYAHKRGRKPAITIRIISPIDGMSVE